MLTDPECRTATSKGKTIRKLSDGGGLYLWVYADGRKYWRLLYWISGTEKSLSLGLYPEVTLKAARTKRESERKHLENKLDPSAERKADKLRGRVAHENSFECVAEEWVNKRAKVWVPSHARDVKRRFESNVYSHIGRRPIGSIWHWPQHIRL